MRKENRVEFYLDNIDIELKTFTSSYHKMMSYLKKIKNIQGLDKRQREFLYIKILKIQKRVRLYKERVSKLLYCKEEIYDALNVLNHELKLKHVHLHLQLVGGIALILGPPDESIECMAAYDIDTITYIEEKIRDIIDELNIDINNDELDHIKNFDGLEFVTDNYTFSNITLERLDFIDVIRTNMINTDPDKLDALREFLEDQMQVEMTVDGIQQFAEKFGAKFDIDDIQYFLNETEYM